MTRRWYVIRTRPQCEYSAAGTLAREGFEVFFPCVRTPRPRRGHDDEPLFPGYLFLRLDEQSPAWESPTHHSAVGGWVRFDGAVPAVPDEVIEGLARRVETINGDGGLWARFRRGEMVRVVSGKMESLAEVLEDATSPEARVKVLLEFMGRQVTADVPWRTLNRARSDQDLQGRRRAPRRTRGRGRWIQGFGPRAVMPA